MKFLRLIFLLLSIVGSAPVLGASTGQDDRKAPGKQATPLPSEPAVPVSSLVGRVRDLLAFTTERFVSFNEAKNLLNTEDRAPDEKGAVSKYSYHICTMSLPFFDIETWKLIGGLSDGVETWLRVSYPGCVIDVNGKPSISLRCGFDFTDKTVRIAATPSGKTFVMTKNDKAKAVQEHLLGGRKYPQHFKEALEQLRVKVCR